MKTPIVITALIALTLSTFTFATNRHTEFAQQFIKAQEAYDTGDMEKSIAIFNSMFTNGCRNAELYYNLANAYFKNGNLPEAVLNYRRAWYLVPRDPDVKANLRFALNAAGAVLPKSNLYERISAVLSMNEWIITAFAAYLTGTILLMLAFLIRPVRRILLKITLLPAAVLLVSMIFLWPWLQYKRIPNL